MIGVNLSRKAGLTINLKAPLISADDFNKPYSQDIDYISDVNCLSDKTSVPKEFSNLFEPAEFLEEIAVSSSEGFFISVPKKDCANIRLKRNINSSGFAACSTLLIEGSAEIIDLQTSINCDYFSEVINIILLPGARLKYAYINFLDSKVSHTALRVFCFENARADIFSAALSSGFTRQSTVVNLKEEGGVVKPASVYLGCGKDVFDITSEVFHQGNSTSSDIIVRGCLADKAQGLFTGNIDISSDAFGCEGYQNHKALLLGEDAVAYAIPNLQIRNNDVSCSHGASIGSVDQEQLFYLASRGISVHEAKLMIAKGFFEPVCEQINWPSLFEEINGFVHKKLGDKNV